MMISPEKESGWFQEWRRRRKNDISVDCSNSTENRDRSSAAVRSLTDLLINRVQFSIGFDKKRITCETNGNKTSQLMTQSFMSTVTDQLSQLERCWTQCKNEDCPKVSFYSDRVEQLDETNLVCVTLIKSIRTSTNRPSIRFQSTLFPTSTIYFNENGRSNKMSVCCFSFLGASVDMNLPTISLIFRTNRIYTWFSSGRMNTVYDYWHGSVL